MADKKFWITFGILFAIVIALVVTFVVFIHSSSVLAGIVCILSFLTGGAFGWLLRPRLSFKAKDKELLHD